MFTDTNTSGNTTVKHTPNDTTKTTQTQTETHNTTTTTQTLEPQNSTTITQTTDRSRDTAEICVSRVDPNICIKEELTHNVEPPTMVPPTQ